MLRTTTRKEWSEFECQEAVRLKNEGKTHKQIADFFSLNYRYLTEGGVRSFFVRYRSNGNKYFKRERQGTLSSALRAQPFIKELITRYEKGESVASLLIWLNQDLNYEIKSSQLHGFLNLNSCRKTKSSDKISHIVKSVEMLETIILRKGSKFPMVNYNNINKFFYDEVITPCDKDIKVTIDKLLAENKCRWINESILTFQ